MTGGSALGVALGTKYTVLPLVAASVPIMVLFLLAAWGLGGGRSESERGFACALRAGGAWSFALREAGIYTAALALPSAFWFPQNWIVTRNPFAPVLVKLGEWTVFGGVDVAATFGEQQFTYVLGPFGWWVFPWVDRAVVGDAAVVVTYSSSVGFGAVLARRIAGGQTGDADPRAPMLLAAVGQRSNVTGMDLENAGVEYSGKGIRTDATLKTTAWNIYAVGDVIGSDQFSHTAEYHANIAVPNALLPPPVKRKADYTNIVWATSPTRNLRTPV